MFPIPCGAANIARCRHFLRYSPLTRFVETRTLSTALKSTEPIINNVTTQEVKFLLVSFIVPPLYARNCTSESWIRIPPFNELLLAPERIYPALASRTAICLPPSRRRTNVDRQKNYSNPSGQTPTMAVNIYRGADELWEYVPLGPHPALVTRAWTETRNYHRTNAQTDDLDYSRFPCKLRQPLLAWTI